jgi:hypothetical protein
MAKKKKIVLDTTSSSKLDAWSFTHGQEGKKNLLTFLELQVWRFELGAWLKKKLLLASYIQH